MPNRFKNIFNSRKDLNENISLNELYEFNKIVNLQNKLNEKEELFNICNQNNLNHSINNVINVIINLMMEFTKRHLTNK